MPECIKYDASIQTRGRTLDYAAGVYDVLSPVMTLYQEQRLGQRAIELLNLKGHEKVLDIGCGTGSLTIEIGRQLSADNNGLVVGIDAASKMIRLACKKAIDLKQVQFDIMAAERLGYEDGSFDGAVSTFFFHHIDFELKVASLNELWRVLKKGKQVIIVDVDIPTTSLGKSVHGAGIFCFGRMRLKKI